MNRSCHCLKWLIPCIVVLLSIMGSIMPRGGKFLDLTGKRFGKLVAIRRGEPRGRLSTWFCQCDCGNSGEYATTYLNKGETTSCGCRKLEMLVARSTKHGMCPAGKGTPEYRAWQSIKGRCYNKRHANYYKYGARGTTVCSRWLESFVHFIADMGNRPPDKTSIDRIDVTGGYWCGKPECSECGPLGRVLNCRWSEEVEQANNRSDNRFVEWNGKRQTLAQWSRETGIPYKTLEQRIKQGWDAERALSQPLRNQYRSL